MAIKITAILLITGIILTANEVNGNLLNKVMDLDRMLLTYWQVGDATGKTVEEIKEGWCPYISHKSKIVMFMVKRIFRGNNAVISYARFLEKAKLHFVRELCSDPLYMEFIVEQNQVLIANIAPMVKLIGRIRNTYLHAAQDISTVKLDSLFCLEKVFIKEFIVLMPTPTLRWYMKHMIIMAFKKYLPKFHKFMYKYGGDPHFDDGCHFYIAEEEDYSADDVNNPNPMKIQSPDLAFLLALDRVTMNFND